MVDCVSFKKVVPNHWNQLSLAHQTHQLDGIPEEHPTIREGQLEAVRLLVETLISVSADKQQIRRALIDKGLPEILVSEAIRRFVS